MINTQLAVGQNYGALHHDLHTLAVGQNYGALQHDPHTLAV